MNIRKLFLAITKINVRVLIICNDFPPLNSIGALRPYSWFRYFKEFGIEPVVVTKQWNDKIETPADVMKASDTDEIIIEKNKFGIIYRMPVKLMPSEKMYVRFGEKKFRFFRRLLTMIYKMLSFVFFYFDKHRTLYFQAKKIIQTEKIDALIISGEPFILFKYGNLLKKEFGIKWIADFRDMWYLNSVTSLKKDVISKFLIWYEYQFEKKIIKNCNFIVTPDPHKKKLLAELHQKQCEIIYNGFENFLTESHSDFISAEKKLILTHTGTLTIGQRVEFLLQALVELVKEEKIKRGDILLQFIGLNYFDTQLKRVTKYDSSISEFIETTPRLPRKKALEINQSSDFLIAFTEAESQTLFAKVYDYIAARKPILVLPGDNGIVSGIVTETNSGLSFYSVNELKKFLMEQLEKKKNGEPTLSFSIVEEKALFYTRENQSSRFVYFLKQLINSSN